MECTLLPDYFATFMMYMRQFFVVIMLVASLASCSSFRRLTSSNTNVSAKRISHKHQNKKVEFLNGIELTPGAVVVSKHKTATNQYQSNTTDATAYSSLSGNIEKLNWLQLKYGVMLNTTVESVSNILLLQKLEEWWGTRYCLGGSTKNCIDCSAFSQLLMHDVYNISLPRTAQEQYNSCDKIDESNLKEGDLVFFHTGGRRGHSISHVGVYITNNKFANASTSGGVTISDLEDPYWKSRYRGAGRIAQK